jgi:hypothetical protein
VVLAVVGVKTPPGAPELAQPDKGTMAAVQTQQVGLLAVAVAVRGLLVKQPTAAQPATVVMAGQVLLLQLPGLL